MKRVFYTTGLYGVIALAFAAVALAAGAGPDGFVYDPQNANVNGEVAAGLASEGVGGALPFTGLDLALIVFGGILLIAFGVVLRRLGRGHNR